MLVVIHVETFKMAVTAFICSIIVFDGTLTDNFQLQSQFVDAENSIRRDQRQNQYSLIFLSPRSVNVIAIYVLFLSVN